MFKFMEICKFKNVETAKMWLNSLYGKNALKENTSK
jgi:hypothetical protein